MRTHLIASAAALLASTGLALAQDEAPAVNQGLSDGQLEAADASDDNSVSLDEFRAYMRSAFDALDADASGAVTWTEAEAAMVREHFDTLDANRDGDISPTEMDAQARTDFAASDRDGDGALN